MSLDDSTTLLTGRDAFTVDRARGCIVGFAVGDALGSPHKFRTREQVQREIGPEGFTTFLVPDAVSCDPVDGIVEVDSADSALGLGWTAILEDLREGVEDADRLKQVGDRLHAHLLERRKLGHFDAH